MTSSTPSHFPLTPEPESEAVRDGIGDDPVYGQVIANYPSDRARLLLYGGVVYAILSLTLNALFLPVDANTAAVFVVGGMSLFALLIGWAILHLWNREVILYAKGFSYREGARLIFFSYGDVRTIRQRAERVTYFGGLVRRRIREVILTTAADDTIVLNQIYKRLDELGIQLEKQVNAVLKPFTLAQLANHESVAFGKSLTLTANGLQLDAAHTLAWVDYAGYSVGNGKLTLQTRIDGQLTAWGSVAIATLENATLLLELLQAKQPK